MNRLQQLQKLGQSIWLDFISRDALRSGELARTIDGGVLGMTSNPAIFEKSMGSGDAYDDDIRKLARLERTTPEIYETLALEDITAASGLLRPVYDRTDSLDGYVSIEVSPRLAHDTAETIGEAKRLWTALNRPNVMIKIPGTPEGVPAIREAISSGINVNVTLLFALDAYEAAALAYIEGLEARAARGEDISKVASVASFFVSRVDTLVDKRLEGKPQAAQLRGKAAIANARLAYERFETLFAGSRWEALAAKGARPQRPLWASTSTKDPSYPDTIYMDALIGPHTVNTAPLQTIEAFADHGTVALTVNKGYAEARATLEQLEELGISMDDVTDELLRDGVRLFAEAFDRLESGLATKVEALRASVA